MNRPVTRAIRVALVTLCLPVHGCDTVKGGAVELSWKLRPASSSLSDKFVECDSGQPDNDPAVWRSSVTQIRLDWDVGGNVGFDTWRCGNNHGVTGFDLPEGPALLSVRPECETGPADPVTFIAPAPEQRTVILGNTVSLGAVELVVAVSYCDLQPCICQ